MKLQRSGDDGLRGALPQPPPVVALQGGPEPPSLWFQYGGAPTSSKKGKMAKRPTGRPGGLRDERCLEDFFTQSRDLRLLIAIAVVLGFPDRVVCSVRPAISRNMSG